MASRHDKEVNKSGNEGDKAEGTGIIAETRTPDEQDELRSDAPIPAPPKQVKESKLLGWLKKGAYGLTMIRRAMFWGQALLLVKPVAADSSKSQLCEGNQTQLHFRSAHGDSYRLSVVSPYASIQKFAAQHKIVTYPIADVKINGAQTRTAKQLSKKIKSACGWKKIKPKQEVSYERFFVTLPYAEVVAAPFKSIVDCNILELSGQGGINDEEFTKTHTCVRDAFADTGDLTRQLTRESIPEMSTVSRYRIVEVINEEQTKKLLKHIAMLVVMFAVIATPTIYFCFYVPRRREREHQQEQRRLLTLLPEIPENDTNYQRVSRIGIADEDVPVNYCCLITQLIMTDPVKVSSGTIFERYAIVDWMRTKIIAGNPVIDPYTHSPITTTLIPVDALRQEIEDYIVEQEGQYLAPTQTMS